jgi:hypothetical protein
MGAGNCLADFTSSPRIAILILPVHCDGADLDEWSAIHLNVLLIEC